MSATTATTTTCPDHVRDRKHTAVWTVRIILSVVFLSAALPKLADAHTAVRLFAQIGAGQWLRYLVGAAELAGAVGLLVSPMATLAAAGLAADMAGASIVNVAVLHSVAFVGTVALFIACVVVARSRPGPGPNPGCGLQATTRLMSQRLRPNTAQPGLQDPSRQAAR
jgi:putative oxidoreductase